MRLSPVAPFMLVIGVLSGGAGVLYAALTGSNNILGSVIQGTCIGLTVSVFERGLLLKQAQSHLRRQSTVVYIIATELAVVVLVTLGFAIGGLIDWSAGIYSASLVKSVLPSGPVLVYALIVAGLLVFISRVRDLLGHDVFTNLLIGRYHKPVEEKRIFLFVDVVGSTAFARTHGDLRAQDYLGAIFAAIAEPVREHRGSIDDYIGDMAMITWPEARGLRDARCIRCVVAIFEAVEANAGAWLRQFGQVPEFHVALHGGSVVTAEVGVDRHKISYFGDVVNTTARIETLCRQLGARFLVSADLLGRLAALPAGVSAFSRGDHAVKGHDQRLEVFSLETGVGSVRSLKPASGATRAG